MAKVAVVVFADTKSHGDLARAVNALETAKECQEANDDVKVIFDGAGVQWAAKMAQPNHRMHQLFESVRGNITGACEFCAGAFEVKEQVEAGNVPLLDEHEGHPSLRNLVAEGYEVITF